MRFTLQTIFFAVTVILLNSCYTSKPMYSVNIHEIKKDNQLTLLIDSTSIFQDSLIKINIQLNNFNQYLTVKIQNLSNNQISINWDEAYFVTNNVRSKLMIIDDVEEQIIKRTTNNPSDTIVSKMSKKRFIMPFDNMNWQYWTNTTGTWNISDLIKNSNENVYLYIPVTQNDKTTIYTIILKSKYENTIEIYDPPKAFNSYITTMTIISIIGTIFLITIL